MKTTEVFVEQVLVGLLVFLTLWLLTSGPTLPELDFSKGAAVVAAAYLVGIVYDRVSDTLLQHLEQHNRLRVALMNWEEDSKVDPFPEDVLRIQVLRGGSNIAEYADYLRSKIRLTRAVATLAPALSVAYVVGKLNSPYWKTLCATGIALAYLVFFLVELMRERAFPLPKTYQFDKLSKYKKAHLDKNGRLRKSLSLRDAIREPSLLGMALLFGWGLVFTFLEPEACLRMPLFAGLILTLLAGWSWWRISRTFMVFLRACSC